MARSQHVSACVGHRQDRAERSHFRSHSCTHCRGILTSWGKCLVISRSDEPGPSRRGCRGRIGTSIAYSSGHPANESHLARQSLSTSGWRSVTCEPSGWGRTLKAIELLGQRDLEVVRECLDHFLGVIAGSLVTDDPNPLITPELLFEVELIPSPPKERSRIKGRQSLVHQLDHRLTDLFGSTSAPPVQRVISAERLQVPIRIVLAEPLDIRACNPLVMTKHPDRLHGLRGVHELNGPVALDKRFRRHHLKRNPAQPPQHGVIVLPRRLSGFADRCQPGDGRAPR